MAPRTQANIEKQRLYHEDRELQKKEQISHAVQKAIKIRLLPLIKRAKARESATIEAFRASCGSAFKQFLVYAKRANSKQMPFYLTVEDFKGIPDHVCRYCGANASGFDRKDSKQGYTRDNVVPCCWACNMMKNRMKESEFIQQVKKIHQWTT